jgi:hypothetical protein
LFPIDRQSIAAVVPELHKQIGSDAGMTGGIPVICGGLHLDIASNSSSNAPS